MASLIRYAKFNVQADASDFKFWLWWGLRDPLNPVTVSSFPYLQHSWDWGGSYRTFEWYHGDLLSSPSVRFRRRSIIDHWHVLPPSLFLDG